MTCTQAEAFLGAPERTRLEALRKMSESEREDVLIAVAFGLATDDERIER